MELEAQRKDEKKQEEEEGTEEPKEIHNTGNDKRMFFILGDTGSFLGIRPEGKMVHEG